jgi:hypothetical protein
MNQMTLLSDALVIKGNIENYIEDNDIEFPFVVGQNSLDMLLDYCDDNRIKLKTSIKEFYKIKERLS